MDHNRGHADNEQHDRYDCCSLGAWRLTIPHFTWRPSQSWTAVDTALDLPTDHDLVALAAKLFPVKGTIRPSHHVLSSLVAERHLARWAKHPMHWRDRTTVRAAITLADGTVAGVAGRWFPFSADLPPVVTIPTSGTKGFDVIAAVAWHGFDFEPEFLGWHHLKTWKTDGHKGSTDMGLSGISLSRRLLLPMTQLRPHTSERQTPLFTLSE